jgi:hypothetical protein
VIEDEFWSLIEDARRASDGDLGRQTELLRAHLEAERSVDALLAFQERWDEAEDRVFSWPVWDAACVLLGFVSDDFFSDVRAWIISHGRTTVEKIAADPDARVELAGDRHAVESGASEDFGNLIWGLWEEIASDRDLPVGRSCDLAGDRIDLKDWSAVRERFPRLAEYTLSAAAR